MAYYFLLSAPRAGQQLSALGGQIQQRSELISAYQQATEEPFGFLLLDLRVGVPRALRLRSKTISNTKEDVRKGGKTCEVFVPAK